RDFGRFTCSGYRLGRIEFSNLVDRFTPDSRRRTVVSCAGLSTREPAGIWHLRGVGNCWRIDLGLLRQTAAGSTHLVPAVPIFDNMATAGCRRTFDGAFRVSTTGSSGRGL